MKPLAKLYLNRQRLYEKACDDVDDTLIDTGAVSIRIKKKRKEKTENIARRNVLVERIYDS